MFLLAVPMDFVATDNRAEQTIGRAWYDTDSVVLSRSLRSATWMSPGELVMNADSQVSPQTCPLRNSANGACNLFQRVPGDFGSHFSLRISDYLIGIVLSVLAYECKLLLTLSIIQVCLPSG